MGNKLEMKEEIQSEEIERKVLFCNWLKQWTNTAGMRGLSDQTFEPAIQTAQTFPPMITYLFDTKTLTMFLPAIYKRTILRVDSAGTASYVVLVIIILC